MYAVISEFNHATVREIDRIRNVGFKDCNFINPNMPWPYHLSWQGAKAYNLEEAENRIQMITKTFGPVETRIDSIGIFPGDSPILFLGVCRTPLLSALNETLWEALEPLAESTNTYFSPEEWIPHITLWYGTPGSAPSLACAMEKMVVKQLQVKIIIDHLIFGFFDEKKNGTLFRYPLIGNG